LNGTIGEDRPVSNKSTIPQSLRAIYAEVVAKALELRRQGKTHMEVCEGLNRLGYRTRTGKQWQHPQQIVRLLRSFSSDGDGSCSESATE
jgi:hypothetical protein